jgi:cephalosporin hydroxylase
LRRVFEIGSGKRAVVILDSNHTKDHVFEELKRYEQLVTEGSYLIVLDTVIDEMPIAFSSGRSWGPGRGPKAAVNEFLAMNDRFVVDDEFNDKLLITAAPGGYLRCIK